MVVAVGPEELLTTMDKVLAWSIAWQGDRRLVILCSDGYEGKTLERLPWITRPIEVHTYGEDFLLSGRKAPLTKAETIALARDPDGRPVRPLGSHELGSETEALKIGRLIRWLDGNDQLTPAGRQHNHTWTCAGLGVARMQGKTTTTVHITAGVDYSKPVPGVKEPAFKVSVTRDKPLTDEDFDEIKARIRRACDERLGGDVTYLEHRMQCNLLKLLNGDPDLGLRRLGIKDARREYPAYRGEGDEGLIDFLGIDVDNRLHIVETKANPNDVPVVLQAIDYSVWVMANQTEIRNTMDPPPGWQPAGSDDSIVIDFICAPKVRSEKELRSGRALKAIGPYMRAQLHALSPDLDWRIWLQAGALDERCELAELPRNEITEAQVLVSKQIDGWKW
jgi:hypothetical protein